jgi:DNA-binding NtrC family response regulator
MIAASVLAESEVDEPVAEGDTLVLKDHLAALERRLIQRALRRADGNHSEASRLLGVTRNGLTMKMKRLGIES